MANQPFKQAEQLVNSDNSHVLMRVNEAAALLAVHSESRGTLRV